MRSTPRWSLVIQALALSGIWAYVTYRYVSGGGLFSVCGVDYALYTSGARLLFSDHPIAVYDLSAVIQELHRFSPYYGEPPGPNQIGPLPYPAGIFLLYAPFAYFTPAWGFGLWVATNLLLAAFVVWRLVAPIGDRFRAIVLTAMALTFAPLASGLFFGQPVAVFLLAFFLAYRALQRGDDFVAGLWAGVLFLKVQYPLPLALVFIYKRRWRALAGMAVTGSCLLASSLIAFGPAGVQAHLDTIRSITGFRQVSQIIWPSVMINWRGFLVFVLPPGVSEQLGKLLTLSLSGLTLASLLLLWRGPWKPADQRFPVRMLGTVIVTLIATYHSHLHGGVLLLVPALDLLVRDGAPPRLRWFIKYGFYVPTLVTALIGWTFRTTLLFFAFMVGSLLIILSQELVNRGDGNSPAPDG